MCARCLCACSFRCDLFNNNANAFASTATENLGITQIAGLSWAQWNANLVMPLVTLQEGQQPLVFSSSVDRCSSPESNENDPNEDDSSEMPTAQSVQTGIPGSAHQQQKGQQQQTHTQQSNKDTSIDGGKSSDGESKNGQGYSCPECGRFYKLKSSLRNHQKWECGKEPQFSCPFCVYKAKQKMHINRHLERMHKEKIKLEMSNGIQVVNIKDESQNLNSTV